MNLTDVADLFEASDCLPHDRDFFWPVADILDCDGRCVACVNDTLIVFDGHPDPVAVKYRPILPDKVINPGLEGVIKMGEI